MAGVVDASKGAALEKIEPQPAMEVDTPVVNTPCVPKTRSKATSSNSKKRTSRGVPATITSAIAARQHHIEAVKSTEKGLEILDAVIEQLKSDEKEGTVSADLSHIIGKSNNVSTVDALDSMISVLDEKSKFNIEFVLGVLGVTQVPEPLLERQRNQGQRAVVTALRTKASQKRRELLKAAKRESARKAAAEKAAKLAAKIAAENAEKLAAQKDAAEKEKVDVEKSEKNEEDAEKSEQQKHAAKPETTVKNCESQETSATALEVARLGGKLKVRLSLTAEPRNEDGVTRKPDVSDSDIQEMKESEPSDKSKGSTGAKESESKKSRFSPPSQFTINKDAFSSEPSGETEATDDAKLSKETTPDVDSTTTPRTGGDVESGTASPNSEPENSDDVNKNPSSEVIEDQVASKEARVNEENSSKSEERNPEDGSDVHDDDDDNEVDDEIPVASIKDDNAVESKSEDEDSAQKQAVRDTPSPSPSPLPRLRKHPKKSISDEAESGLSEGSEFANASLGPSPRASSKESSESKVKAREPVVKEAEKVPKRRSHPQRSTKGRFLSKSGAGSSKSRKSMPKVAVFSDDDESESDDEIRVARSSTRKSGHSKSKRPARKRKVKTENVVETPKPTSGESEGVRTEDEKKSTFERTPREKRMSGRRALLDDPVDAVQRSGRLRRESNHLNHDDLESVLWQRDPYLGLCYRAWLRINNVAIAIPFREPVSSRDAPGYYDVIKKPMDLRTIRTRIMDGKTSTPVEFQRDLNQIVRNAMTYNAKDSDIYELAKLFREKMKTEVDPIVEAWKAQQSGKTGDVSERVAEVQRLVSAGPRISARYPSRRSRYAPPTERFSSPSPPPPPKRRARTKKRTGAERTEVDESEDERPVTISKRGNSGSGRARGRSRKSKGTERTGGKDKEKSKSSSKRKNTGSGVEDEPSSKRRRRTQQD